MKFKVYKYVIKTVVRGHEVKIVLTGSDARALEKLQAAVEAQRDQGKGVSCSVYEEEFEAFKEEKEE